MGLFTVWITGVVAFLLGTPLVLGVWFVDGTDDEPIPLEIMAPILLLSLVWPLSLTVAAIVGILWLIARGANKLSRSIVKWMKKPD